MTLRTECPKALTALVFSCPFRFHSPRLPPPAVESPHASVPLFPADPARSAPRGGDRLAPADAARRYDAAGSRRDLRVPAARPAGAEKNLRDRARRAGPLR